MPVTLRGKRICRDLNNWGGRSPFTVEFSKQASIGEATVHKTDENVLYYEESLEKWETKTKICKNKEANKGKKNILIFRSAPFLIVGSSPVADIIFYRNLNWTMQITVTTIKCFTIL